MKKIIILPLVLAASLFFTPFAMADCKGLFGCTFNVVSKTAKLVIKAGTKPITIATGAVVHAAKSYANGDSAGEIVFQGVSGAAIKAAESLANTASDIVEVGGALTDAAKKAAE